MICHDPPGSIKEEMNFDKFMDGILVEEVNKKKVKEEDISTNRVRKLISENSERPMNRIRFKTK